MPMLKLRMLGAFAASVDDQPLETFESLKVRALVAYLAVESDRTHSRDFLATMLWPDSASRTAKTNLRNSLANLHRVLGDTNEDEPFVLAEGRANLGFNRASSHTIDVLRFHTLIERVAAHRHRRAEACSTCRRWLNEALALYRADFLDGFPLIGCEHFDDWVLLTREAFRVQLRQAMTRLCDIHECMGTSQRTWSLIQRRLAFTPWDERGHRHAMRFHARNGDRTLGLAQYEACRTLLHQEFGIAPSRKTVELARHIRRDEVEPSNVDRGNVPGRRTTYVGRGSLQAEIVGRLSDPDCRSLALIGPGGIGKSHLARVVARSVAPQFSDGAWWIPLTEARSEQEVNNALTTALGLDTWSAESKPVDRFERLRPMHALLVLDDCEHVASEVTGLVRALLETCPHLCILTTSRIWSSIRGQERWIVGPLSTADRRSGSRDRERGTSESALLFITRAREVVGSFKHDAHALSGVERLCSRLSGVPLAIEMAAAQTRFMGIEAIAAQADTDLASLTHDGAVSPTHHRSLRDCLDWSLELLDPNAQALLVQLSGFEGHWTAHPPTKASASASSATWLAFRQLIDSSIVQCELDGAEPRYRLLPTTRALLAGRLATIVEPRQRDVPVGFISLAEVGASI